MTGAIPACRQDLLWVAERVPEPERSQIIAIVARMHRRPHVRMARPGARRTLKNDPLLRGDILLARQVFPDWDFQRIADHVNCNAGRVSEVLNPVVEPSGEPSCSDASAAERSGSSTAAPSLLPA